HATIVVDVEHRNAAGQRRGRYPIKILGVGERSHDGASRGESYRARGSAAAAGAAGGLHVNVVVRVCRQAREGNGRRGTRYRGAASRGRNPARHVQLVGYADGMKAKVVHPASSRREEQHLPSRAARASSDIGRILDTGIGEYRGGLSGYRSGVTYFYFQRLRVECRARLVLKLELVALPQRHRDAVGEEPVVGGV
nr:hypothetical protein [Tanacetum cinerariifolium]